MRRIMLVLFATFFCAFSFAAIESPSADNSYTDDHHGIIVTADKPQFTIKLQSNPTTGYSWFLRKYDANLITPLSHAFHAPARQLVGAPGFEVWKFRAKPAAFIVPQRTALYFVYTRPWSATVEEKELVFKIATQGKK